jgi:hypothetical protein
LAADGSKPVRNRSRITNGTRLLPSVKGSSVWGRIMSDVYEAVVSHCGGDGCISELQRLQARRIAALEAELIYIEDKIGIARLAGEEPPPAVLDLYGRLANGQRRHCEALGWTRMPRDITPNIATYSRGPILEDVEDV